MTGSEDLWPEAEPLDAVRFGGELSALYARIRRRYGPVAPVLLPGEVPAWFVTGYQEVHEIVSGSAAVSRDPQWWNLAGNSMADRVLRDAAVHVPGVAAGPDAGARRCRWSEAVADELGECDQLELARNTERLADSLLDVVAGSGEAELVGDYASRLPLVALESVLGPERDDEGHLPVASIAHEVTTHWIGNTLWLMLTDDRFAATVVGGRDSVGQAMTEVLWHDPPVENVVGGFATADIELGGTWIARGDLVVLGLAAANGDPAVRSVSPDVSGNRAHLSFGLGPHACPYPAPDVAEVIARTAVEVLLDRLPDIELAVAPEELVWHRSVWLRGLTRLPVTFTPAPRSPE